jgi:hypothetical protein
VCMFPNPKRLWGNLQIPHLTNSGDLLRFEL